MWSIVGRVGIELPAYLPAPCSRWKRCSRESPNCTFGPSSNRISVTPTLGRASLLGRMHSVSQAVSGRRLPSDVELGGRTVGHHGHANCRKAETGLLTILRRSPEIMCIFPTDGINPKSCCCQRLGVAVSFINISFSTNKCICACL